MKPTRALIAACSVFVFVGMAADAASEPGLECPDGRGDPPPVEYWVLDHILELNSASVGYLAALVQPDFDEAAPVVDLTGTLNRDAADTWREMTRDRLGDRLIYILGDELIAEDFIHDLGPVEGFNFQTIPGRLSLAEANALVDRTVGENGDAGPLLSVAIIGNGLRLERGTVASVEKCGDYAGQPALCFQMKARGAKQLWLLTSKNPGKVLAITWGDRLLTAPLIREPILSGQGIIPFADNENSASAEIDQLVCDIMRRWD